MPCTRRDVLQFGAATLGGLTVADVLRLRARSAETGASPRRTAVIFVQMGGGPTQFETYDPKADAPAEYRGPLAPISTAVPGVSFCELMPEQARLADRLAVVRSITHREASHIALHMVETGYFLRSSANARAGEMPSVGSIVSRTRGADGGLPAFVSIPKPFAYSGAHHLGAQYNYFAVDGDPNGDSFQVANLSVQKGMTVERLENRRGLLSAFGAARRFHDLQGNAGALDDFADQAFDLMTGERAQRAFDIGKEDPRTRDRYGRNIFGQRMLLARRLVETGVPFVVVRMGGWDDHQQLEQKMRVRGPQYDRGVAALIEDLQARGMSEDVLIVGMGEFGRTPRVNANAGRDHWPGVMSVLLAGGSIEGGRVVGASDNKGSRPIAAPYAPQSVLAMIYRHLGIDPATTFVDHTGRPRYVLEDREPIRELV